MCQLMQQLLLPLIVNSSQQLEQHMFKFKKFVKAKGVEDWQQEKCLWDSFIETIKQLQHSGTNKQPIIINQ